MSKIDAILRDFISSIFAVSFIFAKNMNRFPKKKNLFHFRLEWAMK